MKEIVDSFTDLERTMKPLKGWPGKEMQPADLSGIALASDLAGASRLGGWLTLYSTAEVDACVAVKESK